MFTLPKLNFAYDALDPYIDEETMHLHHKKHHQTYIDKLNSAFESYNEYQKLSIDDIVRSLETFPDAIKNTVRNNAGGHYNHSFFWDSMKPKTLEANLPYEKAMQLIESTFGSYEKFQEIFTDAAISRFGSGWAWLVLDSSGNPVITSTANQDTPLELNQTPILGLDVWEHAYYLKYQNRRPDYIEAWWHVVDWDRVNQRLINSL